MAVSGTQGLIRMKPDYAHEKRLLDRHSTTYRIESPQDDLIRQLAVRTFKPHIHTTGNITALEIGCSNGLMTALWTECFTHLDVVEGSKRFIAMAQERNLANVTFHHTLLETYETDTRYDVIIASYVLPVVMDEQLFLKKVRSLLKPDGILYVVTANANALSRQLAKHMGLIDDLLVLTENERNHGHRRAYDRPLLEETVTQAGFAIHTSGGIFLKNFADFQMDELIRHNIIEAMQIEGLYALGKDYPDLCSAVDAVCGVPND
mgnify:CR=1 FL=1